MDRAIERALAQLQDGQADTGAWPGEYGGPLFLLPMYIGTCHGVGLAIPREVQAEMVRYLRGQQNEDGGWGLHVESHSYQFTSTLAYVALRLSGVPPTDPALERARRFIRDNGSPLAAASWCKLFLALLDLYDYRGLDPMPPELWLLPRALPIHPSRMWCHSRMVYLPISYLSGARVRRPADALIRALRTELYSQPYDEIEWENTRGLVAPSDDYRPVSVPARWANAFLSSYEKVILRPLRRRALRFVLEQVEAEDLNTDYVCLAPVSKLFHLWVWHHARPGGREIERHAERLPEYLWSGADGTNVQGYHSSQLWDTTLATQAILATGEIERCRRTLIRAHGFVERDQLLEDVPRRAWSYRGPSRGGWSFSSRENGWAVTDCTAGGLRVALALGHLAAQPISPERCRLAVDNLLACQTRGGGWPSYELTRGPRWLELFNVSNVFADIMIDHPQTENTAAVMLALAEFRNRYPGTYARRIRRALELGRDFLLQAQRADGSFEGMWGVCFTYGTWFGIEGLLAAGLPPDDERVRRACRFLEQHQLPDGGWGETTESNYRRRYVHAEEGQAVMTSWALLGLLAASRGWNSAIEAGVRFLISRQLPDGRFPPEHIAGSFNRSCAIHYDNYLKIFPLWALGVAHRVATKVDESAVRI